MSVLSSSLCMKALPHNALRFFFLHLDPVFCIILQFKSYHKCACNYIFWTFIHILNFHTYFELSYIFWTFIHILNFHTCFELSYIFGTFIHILNFHTCFELSYMFWTFIHVLNFHTCFELSYIFWTFIHILNFHTYFVRCTCSSVLFWLWDLVSILLFSL